MTHIYHKILRLALLAILSPLFLLADNDTQNITVGERQKNVEKTTLDSLPAEENITHKEEYDSCLGYIFDAYPSISYPASIHWLASVSAFGDSVELEDGSVWKVSSYDQYKASYWLSQDPLIITQNHKWFSNYNYRIINKNSGASLDANLRFGPIKNGSYTLYISFIDKNNKTLNLIRGNDEITHWEICSFDEHLFHDWELSDAIILGQNSGWSSQYESILINVNMNTFVRAKQF